MKKKVIITSLLVLTGLVFSLFFSARNAKAVCYYLGNSGYGTCAGNQGAHRCSAAAGGFYACCNEPGDVCPAEINNPGGNATPVPADPNADSTCGGTSQGCCSGSTCDNSSLYCTSTAAGARCLSTAQIQALGQPVPGQTSANSSTPILCQGNGIDTAIGCIQILGDTTGKSFDTFILKWGIGVGSGLAFLLILYAGFMIMTSAGNPERLKAGQELLTSAISGIILLIFSVFILNFIGVKLLGIFQ